MNLLVSLIRAKGTTIKQLSDTLNIPYHSVFKVCRQSTRRTKTGRTYYYKARYIREAVANWLGLPYDHVWGPNSAAHLKPLLRKEIEQQIERRAEVEKEQKLQALGL